MNELSRHIERILLDHDCVVLPQFGGFVTMETSALREEMEQLFFPPIRIVRFNPDLTEDDGLLASAIRELHHCSLSEAKRHIQRLVLDLRQQLLSDGQMDFGSIGVFLQDEDGRVSFSPCKAGVTTPQLFGLDAFHMPKLTVAQRSEHHKGSLLGGKTRNHDDSQTITLRISKRGLKNTVAAAAIILLCALFSPPRDEVSSTSNQATLLPAEPSPSSDLSTSSALNTPSAPSTSSPNSDSASSPTTLVLDDSLVENNSLSENNSPLPVPQAPTAESKPAGKFCIVLASNVSMKNANNYVQTLKKRGFSNARVYNNGRMNRVILDGYDMEAEAIAKNVALHQANREYASSWVMAL